VNVEITAGPGTALEDVANELAAAVNGHLQRPDDQWDGYFHCAGQVISPTHPLGLPPLVQGATLVLGVSNPPVPLLTSLTEIHVVAGPDSGLTYPILTGRPLLIGRQAASGIALADPDVSRRHAEISTSDGVVRVRDLASVNGTRISADPVGADPQELRPEAQLRLGGSTLMLRGPGRPVAATLPDGAGHLLVNRRTPLCAPRPLARIDLPSPPQRSPRPHLPWFMVLAPLFLAGPAALLWHQPGYLLIAALSPLLMLGQYFADRHRGGKERRLRATEYQDRARTAEAAVAQALRTDGEHLEATHPDLARIGVTARIPTDELWHRTPEHPATLTVRLGRGPAPSGVTVNDPAAGGQKQAGDTRLSHQDVPIVLPLLAFGVVGISGPRAAVLGTARAIIGQLVVLHSPRDLAVGLLRRQLPEAWPHAGEWDWLEWLPHHAPAEVTGIAIARPRRANVLILDGAQRLRRRADVAGLLARASAQARTSSSSGTNPIRPDFVHSEGNFASIVICLARDESSLPLECAAIIVHAEPGQPAVLRRAGQSALTFRPDLAGPRWAARLARSLAPLKDATPDDASDIPHQVGLLDLLRRLDPEEPLDPASLARSWRSGRPPQTPDPRTASVRAVLGASLGRTVTVDLRTDGPHVLVGGTTGSGKSELLQTLIASLALRCSPERLTFLLIDYKGGAAFHACLELPHVGALLTDLDPRSGRRALSSLTAELRRREQLLRHSGMTDIDGYAFHPKSDGPAEPMPRLVIVVDEFRVLTEELPEFVAGLVRIATVGRSLGVHLVLATQRPAGVVSPDIAANVNLRIALRVRDAADSHDLLADPAAAELPAVPGRALVRSGAAAPEEFQTAQVSGRSSGDEADDAPLVRLLRPGSVVPVPTGGAPEGLGKGPTDLERIVAVTRAAATMLGIAPARAPWLPELPVDLTPDRLGAPDHQRCLPFALTDLPDEQRQETVGWDLTAGHLAVVGGPRSGRSTVLRTLCTTAQQIEGGVHIYVLDAAGRLADLEPAGPAHAVIHPDDHERAGRLLRRLTSELRDRQEAPHPGVPVLLLVDGWEALMSAWAGLGPAALVDDLFQVLRDGPGAGIVAAATGGVPLLTGPSSSLFRQRLVLPLPDPTEALVVGVPADQARNNGPPGRGLWLASGQTGFRLAQVARDVREPARSSSAGLRRIDDAWDIPALPTRMSRADLPSAGVHRRRRPGLVVIGMGGERVRPVRLDLTAEPVTLVLGSRGSGRTTAIRSLAEGLDEAGQPFIVLSGRDARRPGAPADLADRLTRQPELVVLLDAPPVPDLAGPGTDELAEVLTAHLTGANGKEGHLVLTASLADLAGAYRGVLTLAREVQQGLVLGAVSPAEGEVFGVRLDRCPAGPPGRGLLVAAGEVVSVQVAYPVRVPDERRGRWKGGA